MPFTIPNTADAAFPAQAQPFATDIAILQAGLAGDGVVSGCAVTAQGTPDMTLAVAAGMTRVAAVDSTVTAGNVTITAANATNPRIDLVVVGNTGTKSVTAGTAAAAPVAPAVPASSVVLAMVYVPANDTAINTNQITDKRVLLHTKVCLTGTAASLFGTNVASASNAGMLIRVTDANNTLWHSDGSAWGQCAADGITEATINAKGDMVIGTAADTAGVLTVGAAGKLLWPNSGATSGLDWVTNFFVGSSRPSGSLAESIPRVQCSSATVAGGTTGQLRFVAIWLPARLVVTSISFLIGSTALSGGTHAWAALYDEGPTLLRQSTDDTSPTAPASTPKTFTLSSTFTTTAGSIHYLAVMFAGSTMPTFTGFAGSGVANGIGPFVSGTRDTGGLLGTAPNPLGTTTAVGGIPYAYVS